MLTHFRKYVDAGCGFRSGGFNWKNWPVSLKTSEDARRRGPVGGTHVMQDDRRLSAYQHIDFGHGLQQFRQTGFQYANAHRTICLPADVDRRHDLAVAIDNRRGN